MRTVGMLKFFHLNEAIGAPWNEPMLSLNLHDCLLANVFIQYHMLFLSFSREKNSNNLDVPGQITFH